MNTGGPAFPTPEVGVDQFNDEGREIGCRVFPQSQGMTLLDWFAGQALKLGSAVSRNPQAAAIWSYEIAAAMLAEKARREGKSDSGVRTAQSDDGAAVEFVLVDSSTGKRMAKLEALNRELAWALETMMSGWVDPYDDNDNVAKARAVLAKAKEVA